MSEQTDVRVEDWNRLQREVARLRILVIIALLAVIALAAVSLLRKAGTPSCKAISSKAGMLTRMNLPRGGISRWMPLPARMPA